jgi:hypothetical protein
MYAPSGIRPANNADPWLQSQNMISNSDTSFGKKRKRSSLTRSGYCLINGRAKQIYKRGGKRYHLKSGRLVKVSKGKKCYRTKAQAERSRSKSKSTVYVYPKRRKSRRRKYVYVRPRRRIYLRGFLRPIILRPLTHRIWPGALPPIDKIIRIRRVVNPEPGRNPSVFNAQRFGNQSSIDYNYTINQYGNNAGTPSMKSLYKIGSSYYTRA